MKDGMVEILDYFHYKQNPIKTKENEKFKSWFNIKLRVGTISSKTRIMKNMYWKKTINRPNHSYTLSGPKNEQNKYVLYINIFYFQLQFEIK